MAEAADEFFYVLAGVFVGRADHLWGEGGHLLIQVLPSEGLVRVRSLPPARMGAGTRQGLAPGPDPPQGREAGKPPPLGEEGQGILGHPPAADLQVQVGPVDHPVEPTSPSTCPASTLSPGRTASWERWA